MRRFWNVVRSRAGLILGSAVVTMLLLPVTALAGGFSGPHGVHHQAATGAGSTSWSTGLAILIGIVAVATLFVLILSRVSINREGGQRAAKGIQRKPAGSAS